MERDKLPATRLCTNSAARVNDADCWRARARLSLLAFWRWKTNSMCANIAARAREKANRASEHFLQAGGVVVFHRARCIFAFAA